MSFALEVGLLDQNHPATSRALDSGPGRRQLVNHAKPGNARNS